MQLLIIFYFFLRILNVEKSSKIENNLISFVTNAIKNYYFDKTQSFNVDVESFHYKFFDTFAILNC